MVQGDEPMVHPDMISEAVEPLIDDPEILMYDRSTGNLTPIPKIKLSRIVACGTLVIRTIFPGYLQQNVFSKNVLPILVNFAFFKLLYNILNSCSGV